MRRTGKAVILLDLDHYQTMVQEAVAAFAHMAGCLLGGADQCVWLPLVSVEP